MKQLILENPRTKEYATLSAEFLAWAGWQETEKLPSELRKDGYSWINLYELVDHLRTTGTRKKKGGGLTGGDNTA